MTALSASYDAHMKDAELVAYPVAANTTVFKGGLVAVLLSSGLVQPGGDTAGTVLVGVAHETKINTSATQLAGGAGPAGAAGALKIRVEKQGSFLYNKAAAVATDLGKQAFIVDDNTVSTAATTNNIACGYVVEVPDASHVRVRINRSVQ